jgi:hypothetical protein
MPHTKIQVKPPSFWPSRPPFPGGTTLPKLHQRDLARPGSCRGSMGGYLGGARTWRDARRTVAAPGRTTIAEHLVKRVCLELCRQLCRVKAPTQCGFAATPPLSAIILASRGASVGKYPKLRTSPSRHFWSQLFIHTSQHNPRDCPRTLITYLRPARSRAANVECIAATLLSSACVIRAVAPRQEWVGETLGARTPCT